MVDVAVDGVWRETNVHGEVAFAKGATFGIVVVVNDAAAAVASVEVAESELAIATRGIRVPGVGAAHTDTAWHRALVERY